jgi:3-hydroxyacyl-CoA dehydrogenase
MAGGWGAILFCVSFLFSEFYQRLCQNVPESLELKRSVVKQLDGISDEDTIIASNSSSFTIQEIIEGLELKNSHRCVSLHSCECYYLLSSTHFANFKHSWNHTPSNTVMDWPPETSAIEVMGTKGTNPEIIPLLMKECKEHGFNPFHVKKNSSGYIYNR